MRRSLPSPLLTALLAALLSALTLAPAARSADWSTWGNSPAMTGRATSSRLDVRNVGHLAKAWSAALGAVVDGQPLYASNIDTASGMHDLYLVATEAGSVVALDARTGRRAWRFELGAIQLGCNQLPGGLYGVTGAMTYDASRQTLFAASTNELANNTVSVTTGSGRLRIFATADGAPLANLRLGRPMFVPPVVIGNDVALTGWTRTLTVYRLRAP